MPMVNLTDFKLDRWRLREQLQTGGTELVPQVREAFMAKQKISKEKVTFSLLAPEARSVQLAGDFTGWQQSPVHLKKLKGGLWKTTVSLLPGRHEYRLLVDGQWHDDPECKLRQANQFGGENCICVVKGA
jgi:1,4-alpha-glucan branching enzyme